MSTKSDDAMARFDKVMRALVAVPKDEALKTMANTIREGKKRRRAARRAKQK